MYYFITKFQFIHKEKEPINTTVKGASSTLLFFKSETTFPIKHNAFCYKENDMSSIFMIYKKAKLLLLDNQICWLSSHLLRVLQSTV